MAKTEPTSADAGIGRPPALSLHLTRRLGMLAMCNVIPLIGGLYVWYQVGSGHATLRTPAGHEWMWISATVLVACLVLALTCWLVMPLARWVRDYPTWQFRHRAKLLWLVPMVGGWCGWLALYLLGAATTLACVVVVGTGLWHLYDTLK
jgi:hypothetical protein